MEINKGDYCIYCSSDKQILPDYTLERVWIDRFKYLEQDVFKFATIVFLDENWRGRSLHLLQNDASQGQLRRAQVTSDKCTRHKWGNTMNNWEIKDENATNATTPQAIKKGLR